MGRVLNEHATAFISRLKATSRLADACKQVERCLKRTAFVKLVKESTKSSGLYEIAKRLHLIFASR